MIQPHPYPADKDPSFSYTPVWSCICLSASFLFKHTVTVCPLALASSDRLAVFSEIWTGEEQVCCCQQTAHDLRQITHSCVHIKATIKIFSLCKGSCALYSWCEAAQSFISQMQSWHTGFSFKQFSKKKRVLLFYYCSDCTPWTNRVTYLLRFMVFF